uniref:Putative basic tail protein n=1 Tax=Amblyomma triste TaxID=251400 RepID=A0A023GC41_AMBTT
MVVLLFLSIYLLNDVHADISIHRGCPPQKPPHVPVDNCNFWCRTDEPDVWKIGFYYNLTECNLRDGSGKNGACLDVGEKYGCFPADSQEVLEFRNGNQTTTATERIQTTTTRSTKTTKNQNRPR